MDSDRIKIHNGIPEDFSGLLGEIASGINYKLLSLLFIIFIFLTSDVFIEKILSNLSGTVGYSYMPTTWGTIIQGVLLVLFYVIADVLIRRGII